MEQQSSGEELLTAGEVAALLFVDPKTVSRWAQSGKLAFIRTPGGRRRYREADVLAIRAGAYQRENPMAEPSAIPSPREGGFMESTVSLEAQPEALAAAVVADAGAIALEAEAAKSAQAARVIAAAAAAAARKATEAADKAARARAFAAEQAAQTVARDAARTATCIQIRTDIAATQVASAVRLAAEEASTADAGTAHLADSAARATYAAEVTAQDAKRAAEVVAAAVAAAAAHVQQMTAAAEEAYANEVTRVSVELVGLTRDTATRVAAETQARAAGIALVAHEAAAALQASNPHGTPHDGQAKTEFVATVSHELRTPMASVAGFIELLQDREAGPLNEQQELFLRAIRRNSDRLAALANDLLTLASMEFGAFFLRDEVVDLSLVISSARATLEPVITARRLDVTTDIPRRPVMVAGDAEGLETVVLNLLSNAVKFTEEGGWVRCTLRTVAGHARLEISDNGLGIPEEEQQDLFTRFFRSSTAHDYAIQGTGLGLTIVDSIVKSHHGDISVVSGHLAGSTFTVSLPLSAA